MRLADLLLDGWQLEDAERRVCRHSETFRVPDLMVRHALQAGDYAKLIFQVHIEDDEPATERMWVIIRDRSAHGYIGMLDNEPTLIAPNDFLWRGAELAFEPRHVIEVGRSTPKSLELVALPPPIPWSGG